MNDVRKGKFHMARIWKKTICMCNLTEYLTKRTF